MSIPKTPISRLTNLPELLFTGRFNDDRDVDWHTHDGDELVLVISGKCATRVGDVHLAGGPGVLWICPSGVPQYQFNYNKTRTVYVGFRGQSALDVSSARAVQVEPDGHVMRWMKDLAALYAAPSPPEPTVTAALLLAVLEEIATTERRHAARRPLPEPVVQAVTWIQNNLSQPLSVPALARRVCISPGHLTALFRQHVGQPPLKYQQSLRLQKSERLLQTPYMSIKQIADTCGFADVNYFVRLFSARHGMPPGKWREQH